MERDLSNSRAILIGGATFRPDSGIADLPAAHASVRAMADLLMTEDLCGWPPDRVEVVVDAPRADLDRRLRVAAAETTGVLLVYYVGRGLPTYTNRLALAVADSNADRNLLPYTSMAYDSLIELLKGPARTKIVILDCEHAELADAMASVDRTGMIERKPAQGIYLLGAGPVASVPVMHPGQPTPFTATIIGTIRQGTALYGPWLWLDQIAEQMRRDMLAQGMAGPIETGTANTGDFPFARNINPRRDVNPARVDRTSVMPSFEGTGMAPAAGGVAVQAGLGIPSQGAAPGSAATGAPSEAPGMDRRRLLLSGGALVGAGVIVGGGVVIARYLSGLVTGTPAAKAGPPGSKRWSAHLVGVSGAATPASAGGALYVLASDPAGKLTTVEALDVATGEQRWTNQLPGAFAADVRAAGPRVVIKPFASDDTVAFGLDAANGRQLWKLPGDGNNTGRATVSGDNVYVAAASGDLYGLRAGNGSQIWKTTLADAALSTPTLSGDALLVTATPPTDGDSARVFSVDTGSGKLNWTSSPVRNTNLTAPLVAGGQVFFTGWQPSSPNFSHVYAYDLASGALIWRSPKIDGETFTDPVLAGGTVVTANAQTIYGVDRDNNGKPLWQVPVDDGLTLGPIDVAAGLVLVTFDSGASGAAPAGPSPSAAPGGPAGTLTALDAATGKPRWTKQPGGNTLSKVVVGASVYVASCNIDGGVGKGGCQLSVFDVATGTAKRPATAYQQSDSLTLIGAVAGLVLLVSTKGQRTDLIALWA